MVAGVEDPLRKPHGEARSMVAGVEDPLRKPPTEGRDTAAAARGGGDKRACHDQNGEDRHLSEDALAEVLGRLRPRWLAACRCVCKAWRDAVDGRGLLRADLLPLSLAGLFVHFDMHKFPELFSRPSSSRAAANGNLGFMRSVNTPCSGHFSGNTSAQWEEYTIDDHCNGLLLLRSSVVVNPATRRWNALPPCPLELVNEGTRWNALRPLELVEGTRLLYRRYLVFDPTVSPHYEVLIVPHLDDNVGVDDHPVETSEWPPSSCKIHLFSSRSGYWEERFFVRDGDAAGTVAAMPGGWPEYGAVYWGGALYVHCQTNFVMRISSSDNKYCVIKPPMDIRGGGYVYLNLARSKKGVYFASLDECWLQVWILNESCGQMEWILKHDKDLKPVLANQQLYQLLPAEWILEDINYKLFCHPHPHFSEDSTKQILFEEKFGWKSEWNSDNDDAPSKDDIVEGWCYWDKNTDDTSDFQMLGFHPYKEIVFFAKSVEMVLAYHLNSSKVEWLGYMHPTDSNYFKEDDDMEGIKSCFPYTPCWMEDFPENEKV